MCRNNHQHDCGHLRQEEEEEEIQKVNALPLHPPHPTPPPTPPTATLHAQPSLQNGSGGVMTHRWLIYSLPKIHDSRFLRPFKPAHGFTD